MLERILVPLDGSVAAESALGYVEDLLAKFSTETKTEITLLQVLAPVVHHAVGGRESNYANQTEAELRRLEKSAMDYLHTAGEPLRQKGAIVMAKVVVGNSPEEIVKAAEDVKADLIAISTHGRSGISRWAFGSVTDRVLRLGVDIPVTVIRALR